jgi:hypothetical protein
MSDDRADRLSRRRKDRSQSRDDASPDNTFKADNTDNTSDTDNTDNASNVGTLDENTKTQMMHLPEEQHKRLMHLYTRMKADYEFEFDDEFEKNRHYFPLVLQYGLDQFEERDTAEIRQDLVEFSNES